MPLALFILGALETMAASLVGRVLLAMALSFVTYTGFDVGITSLLNQIKSSFSSMPVDVMNFLAWLWIDKAIGLMFSAYTAATVVKFSASGSFTKMVRKSP